MKDAEPTPRPWDYVPSTEHHGPYITSDYGGTIADLYLMSQPGALSSANGGTSKPVHFFHEMADPNAELIVRAVNSHDALVAACEAVETVAKGGTDTVAFLLELNRIAKLCSTALALAKSSNLEAAS